MFRLYLFLTALFVLSCTGGKNKPDVSHIAVNLNIERFDKSFFQIDTNHISQGLQQVHQSFPLFYPTFMQDILQVAGQETNAETVAVTKNVLTNYAGFYDSIAKKYNDLGWLKKDLGEGFQYVKYYYPSYRVPRIITFVGPLDVPGIALTNQYLAIGLQQYGGKNFSAYKDEQVQQLYPAYISRRFDKEYIVPNCMKAVAGDIYPDKSVGRPLIEQMIEKGKEWFLTDHFLPDAADSVKTGYTKKQLEWCRDNEGNIWSYVIKNENLYTIEPATIQVYIGEAPFTQGMPEGASPGNIGQWIGWQIVKKFAADHTELTVPQVVQTPAPAIFAEAKYRPK